MASSEEPAGLARSAGDRVEPAVDPAPAGGFLARAREFRRRYQGPEGQFFIRRVNHPAGAVIALALLRTRVTPNAITVAGLLVHLAGAALVAALDAPVPVWAVVAVALVWQLAFSLDCADGQLARARGTASAFGAWFDELVDVVAHASVFTALSLFLVRALALDALAGALLAGVTVSASLVQNVSTWRRQALIHRESPSASPSATVRLLYSARDLLDYGAFLLVASLLLLWPVALLGFLVAITVLNGLYALMQVALNWRLHLRESRQGREG